VNLLKFSLYLLLSLIWVFQMRKGVYINCLKFLLFIEDIYNNVIKCQRESKHFPQNNLSFLLLEEPVKFTEPSSSETSSSSEFVILLSFDE